MSTSSSYEKAMKIYISAAIFIILTMSKTWSSSFKVVMKLLIRTREQMGNVFKYSGNNCMLGQVFLVVAHKDNVQS